jgi:predicted transcriptional regulator of viral defense system
VCMESVVANPAPNWDALFEFAVGQEGYFTTEQAAKAGYSPQLLIKYLRNGRITREMRGVYRIVHYPAGEREDLVIYWLWAEQRGVFSLETALMHHNLSDALPGKTFMTLPSSWAKRRLRVPPRLMLSFADLARSDWAYLGAVPITTPARTIVDCIDSHVSPEFVLDAIRQAKQRGLIDGNQAKNMHARLRGKR